MKKILIFIFVLTAFITESTALEWDFYGKFGSGIWWMKSHRQWEDTTARIPDTTTPDPDDTIYTIEGDPFPINVSDFLSYGTFGVKLQGDKFKSVVEIGIHYNAYDTKAGGVGGDDGEQFYYKKYNNLVNFKKWYFEWYFNDYLSILAGQDYVPTNFSPSNQAFYGENSFSNVGCLYTGRHPMIQFTAGNQLGVEEPKGFTWKAKAAVIKIDTTNFTIRNKYIDGSVYEDTVYYYCEVKVPKLEARFEINYEGENVGFECNVAGGFQRYYQLGMHFSHFDTTNCPWFENGWEKYPIDAFLVGADLRVRLGMFKLALVGFRGQNPGIYGAFIGDAFGWWFEDKYALNLTPIWTDDTLKPDQFLNSQVYEVAAILSFKPMDNLVFECGGGTVQGEHASEVYTREWNPTYAWYFNTQYKILEKLQVKPEVGQYYYGPLFGFGKYTYWGLSTWIQF